MSDTSASPYPTRTLQVEVELNDYSGPDLGGDYIEDPETDIVLTVDGDKLKATITVTPWQRLHEDTPDILADLLDSQSKYGHAPSDSALTFAVYAEDNTEELENLYDDEFDLHSTVTIDGTNYQVWVRESTD